MKWKFDRIQGPMDGSMRAPGWRSSDSIDQLAGERRQTLTLARQGEGDGEGADCRERRRGRRGGPWGGRVDKKLRMGRPLRFILNKRRIKILLQCIFLSQFLVIFLKKIIDFATYLCMYYYI